MTSQKTFRPLLICLPLLLLGCAASGPQFRGLAPVPENAADIVLYRTDDLLDGGSAWRVDLDGKKIAVLRNTGYALVPVAPGSHTLELRAGGLVVSTFFPIALPVSVEANARVFVRAGVQLGAVIPPAYVGRKHALTQVPLETAMSDLQGLKLSE